MSATKFVGPIIDYRNLSINRLLETPSISYHASARFLFYDIFCPESQLERRFKALLPKIKFLVKEGLVDGDRCYMSIKNCDTNDHSTVDILRIHQIVMNTIPEDDRLTDVIAYLDSGYNRPSTDRWGDTHTKHDDAELSIIDSCLDPELFDSFDLRVNHGEWKAQSWSGLKSRIKTDNIIRESIKSRCFDFKSSLQLKEIEV